MIMSQPIAIRARAILHNPFGEGVIMGEWVTFDNLASREAVEFVFGATMGGVYRAVDHSGEYRWKNGGHQRITYATHDDRGINRITVHVLRIDVHGPVPCPKSCICVDCLTALIDMGSVAECGCDLLAYPPGFQCRHLRAAV